MNKDIFPQFIEDFENYILGIKNLSTSYMKSMLSTLKCFFEFVNDHIYDCKYENVNEMTLNDLRFLNTSDLYGFVYYLTENHISIETRITKIEHLRTFFDYLYRIKSTIFKEPLKTIKREKCLNKKLPRYLSEEESKMLLNVYSQQKDITSIRNNAIITMFLNTGIRLSELCNLKISDINFNDNKFIVKGKGNKERYCYLNEKTKLALMNYIELRNIKIKNKEQIKNIDFLFISRNSKRISIRQINRLVKNAYSKAGIDEKQYAVHSLRHSFATILYQSGVDIRLLQILLGHARIETTQIYTHLHDIEVKEVMQSHPLSKFKFSDALAYAG